MNKILFLILSAFLLNISISDAQKSKDTFSDNQFLLISKKPYFKINFPAQYKLEDSKTEKGLKTMFYKAVYKNDVYLFKFTEHKNPAVSSDNKAYMNASLQSFIDGINAELIKKYDYKDKKGKGMEAFLTIPDKNLNVFYRVTIIKHVQYQIIVITKSKDKTEEVTNFFNSFTSK